MQSGDGNYIFAGGSLSSDFDVAENKGASDFWIVKIDSLSNIIWQKILGGSLDDYEFSIIETTTGNIILAGSSRSNDFDLTENHGNFDYWVIKLGFCTTHYYADTDGDGFGDVLFDSIACNQPLGFVIDSSDCNDANNLIYPTAEDICNATDDNCNGEIDEDALFITYYADEDGDTYGNVLNDSISCFEIAGYVTDNTDCNDEDETINPAVSEICNETDDNCNMLIDEDLPIYTLYIDMDADNFGNADVSITSCLEIIEGYVPDSTDCDDSNPAIFPGATELCNYVDDDCDDMIDDNLSYIHSYQDLDGDDFGNIAIDSFSCILPDGFVENDLDCDDTNPFIYPGAPEVLNGLDDDCDGLTDDGLDIQNHILASIKIYPNPAEDILYIQYSGNEEADIEIVTTTGQIIFAGKLFSSLAQNLSAVRQIDVSKYAAGVYALKIHMANGAATIPFVRE